MVDENFRCNFYLDPDLERIHVIALGAEKVSPAPLGGILRGAAELERFITEVGFDSIVTVKQLRDMPDPAFEYTFYLLSADRIVAYIQKRVATVTNAEMRILDGAELTADLKRSLEPFESFVLGASSIRPEEGIGRVTNWFSKRVEP